MRVSVILNGELGSAEALLVDVVKSDEVVRWNGSLLLRRRLG